MELQGTWTKSSEGYMEFETYQLQRLYEAIMDQYYQVYNRCLEELNDEEAASHKARQEGYQMLTDYKHINGQEEFATSFTTPAYLMDIWYVFDKVRKKRVYDKGFIKIIGK